jgi:hypothetical protein
VVKDIDPAVYDRPFSMGGVDLNEAGQLALLADVLPRYLAEYRPEPNQGLSLVDAFVLYALIRHRRPRKIVEIGGGDSTLIALRAVARNNDDGSPCRFICIEPFPRPLLKYISASGFELIEADVQRQSPDLFSDADIVFIDSSHVAKLGSDVNHEMFEVLPCLKPGTLIHWHDIPIPTVYWRDWTESGGQFWNESYLVHAFLMFNTSFQIRWAARWMQRAHLERLKASFPYLTDGHRLSSLWVERVA